jgi:hypothetical protein
MLSARLLLCLVGALALFGCSKRVFHCEQVGSDVNGVRGKDVPRECLTSTKICDVSGPCFEQSEAHCFRTYSSDRYIFICAPTAAECGTLHKQRAQLDQPMDSCRLMLPKEVAN